MPNRGQLMARVQSHQRGLHRGARRALLGAGRRRAPCRRQPILHRPALRDRERRTGGVRPLSPQHGRLRLHALARRAEGQCGKREMIQLSVNPYDARKWIGDCCYAERLIGCPDGNGGWVRWKQGDEHGFYALLNAYVEWQKTVRTRIAPEPTQSSALGKVLTEAGFGSRRTASGMIRTLPDPTLCLERLYSRNAARKDVGTDRKCRGA